MGWESDVLAPWRDVLGVAGLRPTGRLPGRGRQPVPRGGARRWRRRALRRALHVGGRLRLRRRWPARPPDCARSSARSAMAGRRGPHGPRAPGRTRGPGRPELPAHLEGAVAVIGVSGRPPRRRRPPRVLAQPRRGHGVRSFVHGGRVAPPSASTRT
ncbi:hypothetical protein LV779_34580 [Streptomyces thinghirensis]|nr:hypothetical protein [Streptomyces thinghirensis]